MLKGIVSFIILLLSVSVFPNAMAQPIVSSTDTIMLDVNQSFFDGSDVEVPVSIQSSSTVYAVDLAIQFNTARIVFDSLTNVLNGLQYLYYLNPNDSIWRITSYHPNGIQPGTVVFNLRFATTNNEVCSYDFSMQEAYLNGDSSAVAIFGCMDNLGLETVSHENLVLLYPNPFSNQLVVENPYGMVLQVFDSTGRLMLAGDINTTLDTINWPQGIYFFSILTPFGIKGIAVTKY